MKFVSLYILLKHTGSIFEYAAYLLNDVGISCIYQLVGMMTCDVF